jgi:nucleoside permease NupC
MLPSLTLIVGSYVVLRCLQIALQNKTSFAGEGSRLAVVAVCMVVAFIAVVATLNVLLSGVTVPTTAP